MPDKAGSGTNLAAGDDSEEERPSIATRITSPEVAIGLQLPTPPMPMAAGSPAIERPAGTRAEWLSILLALMLLSVVGFASLTGAPAVKDAADNLRMAIDLAHQGVIALDAQAPYHPSMFREPVPVITMAAALFVVDGALGKADAPAAYFSGDRVRYVKAQNLLWLWLLALSAYLAIRSFTASILFAWLGGALAVAPFFLPYIGFGVDSLCTEIEGAALLSAGSGLLATAVIRRNTAGLLCASLCFGLLALTKAATFYVYLGVLAGLAVYYSAAVKARRCISARTALGCMSALAIPFLLLTASWMVRNYEQTGFFEVSERGGQTLMWRALLNDVTPREYLGSFSLWANASLQGPVRALTGFTPADEEPGGRLARLSQGLGGGVAAARERQAEEAGRPEDTITWYRRSFAIYNRLLAWRAAAGDRYPSGAADEIERRAALERILHRPFRHVLLMVPLILGGALFNFALVSIVLAYACRQRRAELALYAAPSWAIVIFYAAVSPLSARNGSVIGPVAAVCLAVLIAAAHRAWEARLDSVVAPLSAIRSLRRRSAHPGALR